MTPSTKASTTKATTNMGKTKKTKKTKNTEKTSAAPAPATATAKRSDVVGAALAEIRKFARAAASSSSASVKIAVGGEKGEPAFTSWCTLQTMPWGGEAVTLFDTFRSRSTVRVLSLDSLVCTPKREGILTRVLTELERDARGQTVAFSAVRIPNVVNGALAGWLRRRTGYRTYVGNQTADFVYMPSFVEAVAGVETPSPLVVHPTRFE